MFQYLVFQKNSRWVSLAFFALVVFGSFIVLTASATPPPGYYMVWNDEFDGTNLDLSKWNYYDGFSPPAVTVTNGNLVITTYTTNGANYSGIILSEGHFRGIYGYYESSIQFGDSPGTWSGFWLQTPSGGEFIGDPASEGAEIDVCEHRYVDVSDVNNVSSSVQETLHWDGYGSQEQTALPGQVGTGLNVGFHTYGVLWSSQGYDYMIDDQLMWTTNVGVSGRSEVVFFSSQTQSPSWAGSAPSGGYGDLNTSTTKMTADYARYYAPLSMLFWLGGSSSDWYDSNNWLSNMTVSATNDVVFDFLSYGNFNINFTNDAVVHTMYLQETPPLTFSGSPLTILGGIDMLSALNSAVISAPVVIGADQTWNSGPGTALTVSGPMSGPGNLKIAGYGTVVLAGSNTCTGVITDRNGGMVVGCTLTNPVFVTGGTLTETSGGLLTGPVEIDLGTIFANIGAPQVISNSLNILSPGSATLVVDPTGGASGEITGLTSVNYGGTLNLTAISGPFAAGQAFKLFDAAAYSGQFAGFSPAIPGYELAWDTSTMNTDGTLRVKAVLPVITTNVVESRSGNTSTGSDNPAFAYAGFSTSVSATKSTAPGTTSSSSRFSATAATSTAFSVTPTLTVGPTYTVDVTWGKNTGTFVETPALTVRPTATGVSSSALPVTSTAFSAGSGSVSNSVWVRVGTITPNTPNPTITFTYSSGLSSGRWYADAVRFISVPPSPTTIAAAFTANNNLVLNWNGSFTLQSATNVAGPYVDVPGPIIAGPYTNTMTDTQRFFRIRK